MKVLNTIITLKKSYSTPKRLPIVEIFKRSRRNYLSVSLLISYTLELEPLLYRRVLRNYFW